MKRKFTRDGLRAAIARAVKRGEADLLDAVLYYDSFGFVLISDSGNVIDTYNGSEPVKHFAYLID